MIEKERSLLESSRFGPLSFSIESSSQQVKLRLRCLSQVRLYETGASFVLMVGHLGKIMAPTKGASET